MDNEIKSELDSIRGVQREYMARTRNQELELKLHRWIIGVISFVFGTIWTALALKGLGVY